MTWRETLKHDVGAYSKKEKSILSYDQINLSENLSPLTNFILDTFTDSINERNLIVTFPNEFFGPKLLLAYTYSYLYGKSTLIFTGSSENTSKENSNKILGEDYQLLYRVDGGAYLFYQIPVLKYIYNFKSKKNKLIFDLYLPRATRQFKKRRSKEIKKELLNSDGPKVILSYRSNFDKVQSTVSEIVLDKESLSKNDNKGFDLNIGCIIIENADRFISNPHQSQMFISWIRENLANDTRIVLHFNNPDNEYLDDVKRELNALVISANKSLLMSNKKLSDDSVKYFEDFKGNPAFEMVEKHNLDAEYYYSRRLNIDIMTDDMDSKGIDELFNNAYFRAYSVNASNLKYSTQFFTARKLMFDMYNLAVSPSFYTFSNKYPYWHAVTIDYFLSYYRQLVQNDENIEFKEGVLHFINSLTNLYLRLSKTKKFGEKDSFELRGKDYKLFNLLANKDSFFGEDSRIVVGTLNRLEPNLIKTIIHENNLFSLQNIEIEYIANLGKKILEKNDKILILPGLLPNQYMFQLYEPYKKIIVLSYSGLNYEWINKEVSLVMNPSLEQEGESIKYLKEVYDYTEKPIKGSMIENYNKRLKKYEKQQQIKQKELEEHKSFQTTLTDDVGIFNKSERIDSNVLTDNLEEYETPVIDFGYKSFETFMDNWEEVNRKVQEDENRDDEDIGMDYNSIQFSLYNVTSGEYSSKRLPVYKTFFTFKGDNVKKGEELTPYLIQEDDYVLIIDNNIKKSLLDFVLELHNLEGTFDSEEIEYWKEKLLEYINTKESDMDKLYDKYCKLGGDKTLGTFKHWCNGNVIGPRESDDLLLIGKVIEDKYLQKNYEYMMTNIEYLRSYHRNTGRQLKKMIGYVISDEDASNLSRMEEVIYDSVKDSIYRVVNKDHSNIKIID